MMRASLTVLAAFATGVVSAQERQAPMTLALAMDTKGEGRPLVLVGGGLTGWQGWIPHQERLAATRRVSRVQPLNVQLGLQNTPLPADYSVKLESRALASGLDRARLTSAVDLVAWSYGAVITLDFSLDHPERVRTLTLIEPPAFWILDSAGQLDERSRRERDDLKALHDEMRDDVSESQLERFLVQAGFGVADTPVRSMPQWASWVAHRRSLLQGPALFSHRDEPSRLRALTRPVLLIKGTGSSYLFHRIIEVLEQSLPDARVVELAGGHAPQLVSLDEFLRILEQFQNSV